MTMRVQRKKFEHRINSFPEGRFVHSPKCSDQFQILQAGEKGVEVSFLRNISNQLSISDQIHPNVFAAKKNFPTRRVRQTNEHTYGCAFARSVGSQTAYNLTGTQRKRNI